VAAAVALLSRSAEGQLRFRYAGGCRADSHIVFVVRIVDGVSGIM
jgi:hypothetical protein